ncbi:MAG: hypothetical protein O7H41_16365 [Planctomycetota bacterium]|nr:hypothetical protein [Planctomycetota bacterium]
MAKRPWSDVKSEIQTASDRHREAAKDILKDFTATCKAFYEGELDDFLQGLEGGFPLSADVPRLLAHLRDYLLWMSWTGWNMANLAPLVDGDWTPAARDLSKAILAHVGGRLIDDGLDHHLNFKGKKETLLGYIIATGTRLSPSSAGAHSAFVGFCAYEHALRRMRQAGALGLAESIDRYFRRLAIGILRESYGPGRPTSVEYRRLVRRKTSPANMILYRPLLTRMPEKATRPILRVIATLDAHAQLINDFHDQDDDASRGQVNAFLAGLYTPESALEAIVNGLTRAWETTSKCERRVRDALASLIVDAGLISLEKRFLPQGPSASPTGRPGPEQVTRAISAGGRHLQSARLESGPFVIYHSRYSSLSRVSGVESPFLTAMILSTLRRIDYDHESWASTSYQYLSRATREDGSVVGPEVKADPNVDEASLVSSVLQSFGMNLPFEEFAKRVADLPTRHGLFETWIRSTDERLDDLDPCVSVNALRFLHQNGIIPDDVIRGLRQALREEDYQHGTVFYAPPPSLPYLVSTLAPGLRSRIIDDKAWRELALGWLDRARQVGTYDPIGTAMCLSIACSAGVSGLQSRFLLNDLMESQQPHGAWAISPMFRGLLFWGSPELTTVLALEALASWNASF